MASNGVLLKEVAAYWRDPLLKFSLYNTVKPFNATNSAPNCAPI